MSQATLDGSRIAESYELAPELIAKSVNLVAEIRYPEHAAAAENKEQVTRIGFCSVCRMRVWKSRFCRLHYWVGKKPLTVTSGSSLAGNGRNKPPEREAAGPARAR